jgi:hypothetical protein
MVEETKEEIYKIFDYDGSPENLGPIKMQWIGSTMNGRVEEHIVSFTLERRLCP